MPVTDQTGKAIGMLFAGLLAAAAWLTPFAAMAQDGQEGRISGLELSGDEPIEIESDKLEVRDQENIAIFTGNVVVVQGETLMKAMKMTVYYAEGSDGPATPGAGASEIERIEVEGKVYLKSEDQVATGDEGSFDMREEVMRLSGEEVVLTQGENVVVGCLLTVEMQTGRSHLEGCGDQAEGGRVKMLLQPGSQNR